MLYSGLAVSSDGMHFTRVKKTPILERTSEEPFIRSAPCVIYDQNLFKTWYVSAFKWIIFNKKLYPSYVIKYAESKDGIEWIPKPGTCISFKNENEFGFGRPWVIKDAGFYKMWYSIRSHSEPYKIGYGESYDGINWIRKDEEAGIERSEQGWDSEMICYPCVVEVKGDRYMFYNGNSHGSTGFGSAIWEGA